jgi:hypothetical protein
VTVAAHPVTVAAHPVTVAAHPVTVAARAARTMSDMVTRAASDWVTLDEAAEILASANVVVRPATIGRWARSGRLSSIKPGGRRYVRRAEVRAMLRPPTRVRLEDIQPVLFEELVD